ncbi:glycosyltransferase family 2 protein [Bifidobacterium choerinum]|uniref:Glycosyltransferase family 2 n=1 Tax=Bifidobacterium choerinum TaxID=35760 RepID=A0A087ADX4_9BIFI|nr:glycosyltransferase family 2 protein [Bifidobacterium choerinum]KFI56974.1 glycosyltransferase family 2 [Bifidobacterium choerinum]
MSDTIDLTIIIPVYRTPVERLRAALTSTTALTMPHECIVVFDGEPESGLIDVVDEFSDDCAHAVQIEHGGVSAARNAGIDEANGRWICFLDSDDRLMGDGVAQLMRFADSHDCQIAQGSYYKESNGRLEHCSFANSEAIYTGDEGHTEFMAATLEVDRGVAMAWSKLYNREFLVDSGVRFNTDLSVDEDTLFVFDAVSRAQVIGFVPVDVYVYQRHEGSQVMKFHEDYADLVERALNTIREEVTRVGEQRVMDAYLQHVVFYTLLLMLHYVFNESNGWSDGARRKAFNQVLDEPAHAYAIRHASTKSFGFGKRMSVMALRHRSYAVMKCICSVRHKQLG